MKARGMLLAALLLLGQGLWAQGSTTSINLPYYGGCAFQASNYLFCSDQANVQVGTDTYVISSVYSITNVYQWRSGVNPQTGNFTGTISFQDLTNGEVASVNIAGTFTYDAAKNVHQLVTSSIGQWTGSFTPPFSVVALAFDSGIERTPAGCNPGIPRYCKTTGTVGNGVLTINP